MSPTAEERLARWILMAHDRLDTDELIMTLQLLSLMLDVRRPGVTVALEKAALIQSHCGAITIIDRKGLRRAANDACGVPEAEADRLFG